MTLDTGDELSGGRDSAAQGAAGVVDALASVAQYLRRGRIGDPEMRRQTKRLAMHNRDPRLLQQVTDEILVIGDRRAARGFLADDAGAGRVHIEGTFGPWAEQAGHPVQQVDDEIAPLLEALVMDRDEILRPG